jgi:hypothetical protein
MKFLVNAAVAAASLATVASAQTIANPSGVVRNFDIANIGPVLTELGVVWEQRAGPDNQPFIVATIDGYYINLLPTSCRAENFTQCAGLHTWAINEIATVSQQSINAFNLAVPFASAGPIDKGFYVSRYDIADYGIARGNVHVSLANFYSIAIKSVSLISGGGQTISTIGYADDMAAGDLNEASGKLLGVDVAVAPADSAAALHLKEIKSTAELVKAFAANGTAAVNKIENKVKE